MVQCNLIFVTEFNHLFLSKCSSIVSDNLPRTAKSRENISLYEFYNGGIIGLPTKDGFYPFGEVVCGSENPSMLSRGWWMDLSYKVKSPLLKRSFNSDGI